MAAADERGTALASATDAPTPTASPATSGWPARTGLPPGPPDAPWSQLARLRKDFLGYLVDAAQYGDLVLLRPAPGARIWLVNHPALVEEILIKRPEQFAKSRLTHRMVGRFLGEGLVLSEGETHRRQRRQLQPAFHGRRLAAHAATIARLTAEHCDGWQAGQRVAVGEELSALGLKVVARTLFGVEPGSGEDRGAAAALAQFAESMAQRFRSLPLPHWLPTPRHFREARAVAALDAAIAALSAPRATRRDGDDLLSLLLANPGGEALDARAVRDHLATFYFAGHETTAKLVGWTLVLLARHRDAQHAVAEEIATLPPNAVLDAAALDALPRLDAVLKESLRLYPPAWVFDREPLAAVQLGGYTVPAGEKLYLSPWVAHRDARYFEAPEAFRPERFAPGSEQGWPRTAYFPFGYGPRNCIGRGLAELNAKATLVVLLRRFGFALAPGTPPAALAPEPGATLGLSPELRLVLE